MASPRSFAAWLAVLHAAPLLHGCRTPPPPPPAPVATTREAPAAPGPASVAVTQPAPATEELRSTAESRRIQAFQLLREAQEAERAGRFVEARNLFVLALELDPNNAAAQDGRNRAIAHLNEDDAPPRRSRTEARIMGNGGPIRYDFNAGVEEADKAVAAKQFGQARSAWRRAREAAGRHPEIFAPADMLAFQSVLRDLDRRIRDAEAAEIQSLRRAGRHEAAARMEAQRDADQATTAPAAAGREFPDSAPVLSPAR